MNETKFKVGDKVKFIDEAFPTVVNQTGVITYIDSLGIRWAPNSQTDNYGNSWYGSVPRNGLCSNQSQLQLIEQGTITQQIVAPPCPNCQRILAPEHIQNGIAKCWFCEMTGIRVP